MTDNVLSMIKIGEKDHMGLVVVNIFVKKEDYYIYEVEHDDVYYRLRISLHQHSDADVRMRLDLIQQDLLQSLALLKNDPKRHSNLIQRIAYTVSIALRVDYNQAQEQFSKLTEKIKEENLKAAENQKVYSGVTVLVLLVVGAICWLSHIIEAPIVGDFAPYWFAGLLGGVLSMCRTANLIDFSDFLPPRHYIYLALERMLVVTVTVLIAYFFIKSNLIFPELSPHHHSDVDNHQFRIMACLVIAGFSETLIPSVLNNFNLKR